jgi:CRP/FNR family transcriptional regulator, cyclic AMP receptor protein
VVTVQTRTPPDRPAGLRISERVRLLEVDPDLAAGVDGRGFELARQHLVAQTTWLEPGPWDGHSPDDPDGTLGMLMVSGLVLRHLRLDGRACSELLGPGDILRPWSDFGYDTLPISTEWQVVHPSRFAILDREVIGRAAHWPEVLTAVVERTTARARRLAVLRTILFVPRVEDRLLYLFWHLADRWGRVRADGVLLPLSLTHGMLSTLVGARRPSVTTALGTLQARGLVGRADGGTWVLHGGPPAPVEIPTDGAAA